MTEAELHRAVAKYLAHALPLRCVWTTVGHGGGGRVRGAHLKAAGVRAGWPDVQLCWDGRLLCVELKAPKGRVSDAQRACHDDLIAAGAGVAVCRSIADVEAALREWGIPLRAVASA